MLNPVTTNLMKELQQRVEGLLHYSDSHSPYNVSALGKGFNCIELIKNGADNKPMVEITAEVFFSKLIKRHFWLTEAEKARIKRYEDLECFCKLKFAEIKIIKIGEFYLDVHIIGMTEEGDSIILSTSELHMPIHMALDY